MYQKARGLWVDQPSQLTSSTLYSQPYSSWNLSPCPQTYLAVIHSRSQFLVLALGCLEDLTCAAD